MGGNIVGMDRGGYYFLGGGGLPINTMDGDKGFIFRYKFNKTDFVFKQNLLSLKRNEAGRHKGKLCWRTVWF
ncbi:MAG: hypothetical protein JWO03_1270 [Bacteroidetes bacterium]|nr:hypothetical protein [Bacteroidota bacterium]